MKNGDRGRRAHPSASAQGRLSKSMRHGAPAGDGFGEGDGGMGEWAAGRCRLTGEYDHGG